MEARFDACVAAGDARPVSDQAGEELGRARIIGVRNKTGARHGSEQERAPFAEGVLDRGDAPIVVVPDHCSGGRLVRLEEDTTADGMVLDGQTKVRQQVWREFDVALLRAKHLIEPEVWLVSACYAEIAEVGRAAL